MSSKKLSYLYFFTDIAVVVSSIWVSFLIKGKGFGYFGEYRWYFITFVFVWLFVSAGVKKYWLTRANFRASLGRIFTGVLIILGLMSLVLLVFRDFLRLSRFVVYVSILFATLFDLLVVSLFHGLKNFQLITEPKIRDEGDTVFERTKEDEDTVSEEPSGFPPLEGGDSIADSLREKYFPDDDRLRDFLGDNIELERIAEDKSLVLDTGSPFNLSNFEDESKQLLINRKKVNDLDDIDDFFWGVNRGLKEGGYFGGRAVTISQKYDRIMDEYPPVLNYIVYGLDFILTRAMPKFSSLRGLHEFITQGKDKALSKAEILGRLSYGGFDPVAFAEIDDQFHFIARKVASPKEDGDPSYGLLIKLERVGKGGKLFNLYKLRTMHPYSEYIQDYVYESNELAESGKIQDDFRITSWGRILRKVYLDEAPEFINIFKGDMSLVGVRPLSKHFFDLYPEDMQKKRVQFKPGLVPPYYVHLPVGLEEIVESERKYLDEKEDRPVWTDVKYFVLAWRNILFRRGEMPGG